MAAHKYGAGSRPGARISVWALLALLLVALLGAACSEADAAPQAVATATPEPRSTVGLLLSSLDDPLYILLRDGVLGNADYVNADIIVRQADNDSATQLEQIDELLALGVDALVLHPVNSAAVSAGVRKANSAGVSVVTVERRVRGASTAAHVAPDNIAGGEMAAAYLVDRLEAQGKIAELTGSAGTSAAQDRGSGFNRALRTYASMEIVARATGNFDREQARDAFAEMLEEHADIDAVFAHNDAMILGAIEAAEEAGRADEIIFVGFDGMDEAIEAIEGGRLAATIAQQAAEMGRIAVEIATGQLRGDDVSEEITVDLALIAR